MNNITRLKELLTPYNIGHKKIHVGPEYDGGYVISENCLKATDAVYSLGIGTECDFDLQLAEQNYIVYQYESSFPAPPRVHPNFRYKQLHIGPGTLESEVENNNHLNSNLLLSMDIEGGEYEVLLNLKDSTLHNFKQIVFEIHDVLYNSNVIPLLERLTKSHCLIHIHANNNCIRQGAYSSGVHDGVPNVMELTYVHHSEYTQSPAKWDTESPINNLDFKNQIDLPEVSMNWWL